LACSAIAGVDRDQRFNLARCVVRGLRAGTHVGEDPADDAVELGLQLRLPGELRLDELGAAIEEELHGQSPQLLVAGAAALVDLEHVDDEFLDDAGALGGIAGALGLHQRDAGGADDGDHDGGPRGKRGAVAP
jgi:hypothetical protein